MNCTFKYIYALLALCFVGCTNIPIDDDIVVEEEESYLSDEESLDRDYVNGDYVKLHSATINDEAQGVNFILVGDGFTTEHMAQGGTYETVMKIAKEALIDIEPLKSYSEYVNIYFVVAVSEDSGIEEGGNTAIGCEFGEGTLISGSETKAFAYGRAIPGISLSESVIVVVLNSGKYAGTTYQYSLAGEHYGVIAYCPIVSYNQAAFGELIHHEALGHGLGWLMDEYIYYDESIKGDSEAMADIEDTHSYGGGVNISLDIATTPWSHFVGLDDYDMVGSYEGGYFYSEDVWRPEENSCMNNNVSYFNAPSREAMVKRLFDIAGCTYDFDEFKVKDAVNLTSDITSRSEMTSITRGDGSLAEPLHPPIRVEM